MIASDVYFIWFVILIHIVTDVSRQVESVPFFRDHMFATPDVLAEGYLYLQLFIFTVNKRDYCGLNRYSDP